MSPLRPPGLGAGLIFVLWTTAVTLPITYLMAGHLLPLPWLRPAPLLEVRASSEPPGMIHVLAAGCGCSLSASEYLLERGPQADIQETVWWVGEVMGDSTCERLQGRGYRVVKADPESIARSAGVTGAPWLLILGTGGNISYSGGYSAARPRSPADYQDLAVFRQVQRGESVARFPAFGCATAPEVRRWTDPLRLKTL